MWRCLLAVSVPSGLREEDLKFEINWGVKQGPISSKQATSYPHCVFFFQMSLNENAWVKSTTLFFP